MTGLCPHSVIFDSHAHLDAPEFDGDRARVLRDARAAGVAEMLIPAVTAASWPKLEALCTSEPGLHPAYGLHPCYLNQHAATDLAALDAWLRSHPAAAVGECGLDYMQAGLDRERQVHFLRGQFEIARRFDLPLVLHARHAFEAVILELRGFGKPLRGVVHSFSGSAEQAQQLWKLGFHIGIGGPVTHERARRLRNVIASVPAESLLLETDAPDQPGAHHKGKRNEPAFLREILHCVARLRGEDPDDLARTTTANARRLFRCG
ncbi:MAG: TatD family hydrolase [Xanthomonadaceae bacterium]|nr:TatD family hydrolase [Xanthomonadaceae bacterium]MDE2224449.1 TatD family hydrolase [Xanthomonadaceae bacterium]